MARSRNIKPGFYDNELLAECSDGARLLFPALWMLADRDGYLEDRPKRIKKFAFGYDQREVEPLMDELRDRGFLEEIESANGSKWLRVPHFGEHQNPHFREPSRFQPEEEKESPVPARGRPEASTGRARDRSKRCTVRGKRESESFKKKKEEEDCTEGCTKEPPTPPTAAPSSVLSKEGERLAAAYPEGLRSTDGETMRIIRSVIKPERTVDFAIERIKAWEKSDRWARGFIPRLGKFFSEGTWLADPPVPNDHGGSLSHMDYTKGPDDV